MVTSGWRDHLLAASEMVLDGRRRAIRTRRILRENIYHEQGPLIPARHRLAWENGRLKIRPA